MKLVRSVVLEGAGSTGKTELVRLLAREWDVPFMLSSTRHVLSKYAVTEMGGTITEQVAVQRDIAFQKAEDLRPAEPRVIDRGLVSVYAWTLFKLGRVNWRDHGHNLTRDANTLLEHLKAGVAGAANDGFAYILCPPNIPLEPDGVRATLPWQRRLLHYLIQGILEEYGYDFWVLASDNIHERAQEALAYVRSVQGVKHEPEGQSAE